jgi:TonB family protein
MGWSVQAVSLVCLFSVPTRFHQNPLPPESYRVTDLVPYKPLVLRESLAGKPPALARSKPSPENKPTLGSKQALENKLAAESKTPLAALVVTPQVKAKLEHEPLEPELTAPALKLENKIPMTPTAPKSQIVAVGTFSHDSPVTATAAKPVAEVGPGGFGDVIGKRSGYDHGMAATNPSVVMSSGFSNGVIDALNNASIHPKARSRQPSSGADAPVEIIFKPKPDYTDEGRKRKINGEVRLEVLFRSDGRVQVVRVVQALGYGLDEQAVKAAEQIKFTPALREGQPIDSMALVHIIFELIS